MGFIENALGDHERLVLKARFPWLLRAASWGALVLLAVLPLVAYAGGEAVGEPSMGWRVLTILSAATGLGIFAATQVYMKTTELAITSHRFVIKRGLVARRTDDIPLTSVENVDLDQSVMGRIFRYGYLHTSGSGGTDLKTPPLQDPVSFRVAMSEARIALTDAPAFEAKPRRIDPLNKDDAAPLLDARGRTRHAEPEDGTPLLRPRHARGRRAPAIRRDLR